LHQGGSLLSVHLKNQQRISVSHSEPASLLAQGLAYLHKAVRGVEFYPPGHPYRLEAQQRAFELFQRLVAPRALVFTVNRQGFMLGGERVEGGAGVLQLAHECVIRRISSIAFMQDLLLYDLDALVQLLSSEPHSSAGAAVPDRQLGDSDLRTIWINERDIASIAAKRAAAGMVDGADAETGAGADDGDDDLAPLELTEVVAPAEPGERSIPDLLRLMAQEKVDARYQELGSELSDRLRDNPDEVFIAEVLDELLQQHRDPSRSAPQREYASYTFGQLAEWGSERLFDALESKDCRDKESIHRVLAGLGSKGTYWIIERICVAKGLYERKSLAAALVALGPSVVTPLITMLKDKRWYVVRNMVSILGELRCRECVSELKGALNHQDERVRKEAIRALVRIGGEVAESALIPLLDELDEVLVRRTIVSLGLMRSALAIPALLRLLERRDLLLKELVVKKEVLAALAAIGDRSATPRLLSILGSGWPAVGRWLELKVAVASAIGTLGDQSALPVLKKIAAGSGTLAEACRDALAAVESVNETAP
jgi:HEAT repeat protein